MHKLYEYVCDELKDLEKRAEKGNLSMQEVQYADTLAHLKKNLMKADEMMEDEYGEYSMSYYPMTSYAEDGGNKGGYTGRRGRNSYARGGRGGRRGGANQYGSYMGGYSRAADDLAEQLRGMMSDAPDEKIRMEIERLANKVEQM